jgi:hypothetical protein
LFELILVAVRLAYPSSIPLDCAPDIDLIVEVELVLLEESGWWSNILFPLAKLP